MIMKFLPIIVFFIILAAAGAYYVLVMMPANSEPQTPSQPIAPIEQNASPSNPPQQASGPIDCGVDMDCFIRASSTCQVANVTRNLTVDSFGMLMSATTYMEIRNAPEAGKCMLYSLSMDSSAKFSDSTVVAALAKGISMDEIRKQEAESTKQARAAIGLSGTCKYGAAELSALLNKWKAGQFSSSDYSGADCSGKMFEGTNISTGFSANLTLKNSTSGKTNTSTKANTTAPAAKANTTAANTTAQGAKTSTTPPAAKTSTTPANTTAATTNATNPANASVPATAFQYYSKYTTYFPERLVWFCTDRKAEFYRMHWQEYYGGDCITQKAKDGFVNFSDYVATGCTLIPCCISGPYNEYSRLYDYFECGSN